MADDKTKINGRDRAKVSGSEQFQVRSLAEKHGITTAMAREVVQQAGNSREKADAAERDK